MPGGEGVVAFVALVVVVGESEMLFGMQTSPVTFPHKLGLRWDQGTTKGGNSMLACPTNQLLALFQAFSVGVSSRLQLYF